MTPEKEVIRGADAARIVNDPLFQEAFSTVEQSLINSMAGSALGDAETHHRQVIALQVLRQVKRALESVIETGNMAEIQLKDKRKFFG